MIAAYPGIGRHVALRVGHVPVDIIVKCDDDDDDAPLRLSRQISATYSCPTMADAHYSLGCVGHGTLLCVPITLFNYVMFVSVRMWRCIPIGQSVETIRVFGLEKEREIP
jgi:hypothetical protein